LALLPGPLQNRVSEAWPDGIIGAGGALIIGYAFNRGREHFNRADFEDTNEKALKMTIAEFRERYSAFLS
jgi:hypothetical protein